MKKELTEPRAWFTVDELNAWADKKLKENPQWAEKPAQQQEPVARVCYGQFTLTQTDVGIGDRGMQAYEEAKKRGWVCESEGARGEQ